MEHKPKKLALIASQGTLDWAYPPFILASAAAAMDWEVAIFFTFCRFSDIIIMRSLLGLMRVFIRSHYTMSGSVLPLKNTPKQRFIQHLQGLM